MEKGKKSRREEEEEKIEAENSGSDHSLSHEQNLSFSDTLVALRIMRAQFPQIEKVAIQPFILQSQFYSSVKDRNQVDMELECSLFLLEGRVKDEHIRLLINAGLLVTDFASVEFVTCQLIDPGMYWLAIPNIGSILNGLTQVDE